MKRKTPSGYYFVLIVAALGFVYATGLTRLPAGSLASPVATAASGHNRIGVYMTSYALTKASVLDAIFAAREAGQIDTLVINVKNMHGEVTYDSAVPLAHEIGASTGRLDLPTQLDDLRARGFYLIARQVVFYDPLLAAHLGFQESWVPGDNAVVCDYNLAIASEVADLGFDELQFDYVRYPDGGELDDIYDDRFAAITAFLAAATHQLGDRIQLSADLFGRVMWPWNSRRIDPIGQSLEDMAPYLDFVSPMVYPSHYYEQLYRDDPYRTVQDALVSGTNRVDANYRPFLQAFDRYIPAGMTLETYIREQIDAAKDHGADGYLFWHPACEYAPLFNVLEPGLN
ncbi:putative glycoside hydrolase [Candidatus Bipolaricaulota bacterium]|nr:putative glycoside hydrolase [Candidatus Bipolaricaulota bacterium]